MMGGKVQKELMKVVLSLPNIMSLTCLCIVEFRPLETLQMERDLRQGWMADQSARELLSFSCRFNIHTHTMNQLSGEQDRWTTEVGRERAAYLVLFFFFFFFATSTASVGETDRRFQGGKTTRESHYSSQIRQPPDRASCSSKRKK